MAYLARFAFRIAPVIRSAEPLGTTRYVGSSSPGSSLISPQLFRTGPFSTRTAAKAEDDTPQGIYGELCQVSCDNHIKRLRLNNPKKRNSLSCEMMKQLHDQIRNTRDEVRLIILSANGPVFSSGHDLKELALTDQKPAALDKPQKKSRIEDSDCFWRYSRGSNIGFRVFEWRKTSRWARSKRAENGKAGQEDVFRMATQLMNAVEDCPVPVIAQVNGHAAAAGCQLIATCDIVVASIKSQFSTPGVSSGIFCSTPGIPLVRSVPLKVAAKMLFTGDAISAQEAYQFGLITSVVEEDKLEDETLRIAHRIIEKSPRVIKLGKQFLKAQAQMDKVQAYAEGERVMVRNLELEDCQEGLQAFFEKRKPKW